MKQSSIDWLAEQLKNKVITDSNIHGHDAVTFGMKKMFEYMEDHIQTAREMHRQEIEEAYNSGAIDLTVKKYKGMREYYSETFKQP